MAGGGLSGFAVSTLMAACAETGGAVTGSTSTAAASAMASGAGVPSPSAASTASTARAAQAAAATTNSAAIAAGSSATVPAVVPASATVGKAPETLLVMAWTGAGQWSRGNWESYGKTQLGTNVTVQILPTGGNSADQKLLIAVSAGTPPGLFWTGRATVAGWGLRGIAQPLDDRLAKSTVIQNDNFIAHALDENRWKGKVYGLYWSADARILYWNKDLFHAAGLDPEQPPQTWDQFGTVMQRLTKNLSGGDGQVLGFNPTYVSVGTSIWETWFWELGGSYLSADGTHVTIANDAGVGALDWMVKQAQVQGGWNAITSYWSAAGKNAGSATAQVGWGFGLQKVAMLAEVGNAITNLRTHWPGIRYGVAGIPAAASGKRASVRGGYSWVLPTGATAPDTAWAFLEWAFAAEQSLAFKNQFTRIPTTLDAIKSPKWLPGDPMARQVMLDVVQYSQRIPCISPGLAQILPVNQGIPTTVLEGNLTAQTELTTAQSQIQAILNKALPGQASG